MRRHIPGLPSPAMVVAATALFIALGGTGYAASTLIHTHRAVAAKKSKHADAKADKALVKSLAPGLSVAFAKTAGSAGSASSATNAGHATSADHATNANHASSADNATNATTATNATNATNAGHASTADSATNATNAAHATTADSAPLPTRLPTGETITGAFAMSAPASAGGQPMSDSISWSFPLSARPTVHVIPQGGAVPSGCSGTLTNPGAASGNLCIFVSGEFNDSGVFVLSPDTLSSGTAGLTGVWIFANSSAAGVEETSGTWAVTG